MSLPGDMPALPTPLPMMWIAATAEHLGSAQALTDAQYERAAFCTEGNNLYTHATLCIGADNASDCLENPFGDCEAIYGDTDGTTSRPTSTDRPL